ncbi:MAG: helix-turn-helix domain-containing protein [Rhodospirillales bacterium]|nr:helix-turn-helix domain-containing protein [Rhodospirillales bacterium]
MIISAQCRAARALLNWSRKDLADAAKVAERTIVDFERGAREPYERTLRDIREALEGAGVVFIAQNGDGPGVRLKKG